ncbi:MAG: hypothetical protein QM398_05840 [Thermoproteota archaeon]|nr:hypothetical protein [Thermoproteota archaeon]NLD65437.1 hypothetical protein [Thermoproteota archaeon]
MSGKESTDNLKGTTLEIYRFMLKIGRPVGVREVQRGLNLSSPSIAVYHLSKLEDACLVKRQGSDYVINKVLLQNSVRIGRFLFPKYLFYSILAVAFLIVELTILRPATLSGDYFFFTISTAILSYIFCYETAKTWIKGIL